jgi:transcriptional regulator with XRE-family HTH domain
VIKISWLKQIRIDNCVSQDDVATACGISRQYYSLIENGDRGKKLPVPTAKKIAGALGIDWTRFYEDDTNGKTDQGKQGER